MALLSKLKNAFGFSDAELENEINGAGAAGRDAHVVPLNERRRLDAERRQHASDAPKTVPHKVSAATTPADVPVTPKHPRPLPDEIFTSVVEIFNASLPEFLRNTVDENAQRKYLYEALDEGMKAYLAGLENAVRHDLDEETRSERETIHREMDELEQRSKRLEQQNTEWNEQRLSADRQKRALTQRVHDLEEQVASFAAEREQFELENKSLVNKLRAMSVDAHADAAVAVNAVSDADLEALRSDLDAANAALATSRDNFQAANTALEAARADLSRSQAETEELRSDIDTLKKRCELADAMINDLNHKAADAQAQLADKEKALDEALGRLADNTDAGRTDDLNATIESLNERLRIASTELESRAEELRAAREEVEESQASLLAFEESLEKFEQIKESKDRRIAELKKELAEREATIAAQASTNDEMHRSQAEADQLRADIAERDATIESLRATIENNLHLQAESEAALRAEIENIKKSAEPSRRGRRRAERPTDLDASLDDTNWLVSTPPPGSNARLSNLSDEEFGYHEPARRDNNSNDNTQLLLW